MLVREDWMSADSRWCATEPERGVLVVLCVGGVMGRGEKAKAQKRKKRNDERMDGGAGTVLMIAGGTGRIHGRRDSPITNR